MKKLEMVQGAVELVVSIGVGLLAGNAINLVKPKNLGILKRIAVGVGGWAISNMAADKVTQYVDEKWIETSEQIKGWFHKKELTKNTNITEEEGA